MTGFYYTIKLITIKLCTKFQNPNSSSCWEIFDRKKYPYVLYKSDRRKKWKFEKRRQMRISTFIFICTIHLAYRKVYTKFENTGPNRSWEIYNRNFRWRERKLKKQTKELISNMWLFFCYTTQLITIKLCTKFQNPKSSISWEILGEKKFTDRQTLLEAKTIYPLYTS